MPAGPAVLRAAQALPGERRLFSGPASGPAQGLPQAGGAFVGNSVGFLPWTGAAVVTALLRRSLGPSSVTQPGPAPSLTGTCPVPSVPAGKWHSRATPHHRGSGPSAAWGEPTYVLGGVEAGKGESHVGTLQAAGRTAREVHAALTCAAQLIARGMQWLACETFPLLPPTPQPGLWRRRTTWNWMASASASRLWRNQPAVRASPVVARLDFLCREAGTGMTSKPSPRGPPCTVRLARPEWRGALPEARCPSLAQQPPERAARRR